jgi:hypothetical protein
MKYYQGVLLIFINFEFLSGTRHNSIIGGIRLSGPISVLLRSAMRFAYFFTIRKKKAARENFAGRLQSINSSVLISWS